MKNWRKVKVGVALVLSMALTGCKAWNCGCPMSNIQQLPDIGSSVSETEALRPPITNNTTTTIQP